MGDVIDVRKRLEDRLLLKEKLMARDGLMLDPMFSRAAAGIDQGAVDVLEAVGYW